MENAYRHELAPLKGKKRYAVLFFEEKILCSLKINCLINFFNRLLIFLFFGWKIRWTFSIIHKVTNYLRRTVPHVQVVSPSTFGIGIKCNCFILESRKFYLFLIFTSFLYYFFISCLELREEEGNSINREFQSIYSL